MAKTQRIQLSMPKDLMKLMGGSKKFVDKLQSVFDEGNYDPANEPDIA